MEQLSEALPGLQAACLRGICIANAGDADSAVRHRLMQCKKGLENSKSNYYSCATEVKRRLRLLRAQIPDR